MATKFNSPCTTLIRTQYIEITSKDERPVGYAIIKYLERKPYRLYQFVVCVGGHKTITGKTKYRSQLNCFDRMCNAIKKIRPDWGKIETTGYSDDIKEREALERAIRSTKNIDIVTV